MPYHEVRERRPPVLLIMGFTGDGGHFETLAELLADEFTVITYDRRGNGRSPPPGRVGHASPQQADDAAALRRRWTLRLPGSTAAAPGASFALCLTIPRSQRLRCAVLHEPGPVRLFDDPARAARSRRSCKRP